MIEVDAILFDLDGTLIDSRHDIAASVRRVQSHYGQRESTDEEVSAFIGDGIERLVERALPGHPAERLPEAVEQLKTVYAQHCLDTTRLYPGTEEVLRHYQHKKLAVVTNKPERISRRMIEALGIDRYFSVLIGGNTYPVKKPDPQPLLRALERLGNIVPARAVMVGDGEHDVAAGRAAGLWTAGLLSTISQKRRHSPQQADYELVNLMDLMRIFN